MFHLKKDKVNFDNPIGNGASGEIFPFLKPQKDREWVLKRIIAKNVPDMLKHVNEIVLGFSCDHPNVLPVKGYDISFESTQRTWTLFLKLPRMAKSLQNKIASDTRANLFLSEKEVIQYFYQISSGLAYLHNRKISHKDIKPDNILIDREGNLNIADIGIGELLEGETSYDVTVREGTVSYSAPEILDTDLKLKKGELLKADAWSLGVVMTEICLMKFKVVAPHFSGQMKETEFHKKLEEAKARYSSELIELIKSLLKADRNQRKTVVEINSILKKKYANILNLENQGNLKRNDLLNRRVEEEKIDDYIVPPQFSLFNKKLEDKWSKLFKLGFREDDKRLEALACPDIKLNETEIQNFIDAVAENQKETTRVFDELFMIMRGCKDLNDATTKALSSSISTNLSHLKTLKLYFTLCSRITDTSAHALILDIGSNLKSLTALGLGFSGCNQLTNKTVQELSRQLKENLSHLASLDLFFNFCDKVSESTFKGLIENLPNGLRSLNLHLGGCKQITNQVILELSLHIKNNLKHLTSLALLFHECDKITDEAAIELVLNILTNLKSLKHFVINFERCPFVTDQTNKFVGSLVVSVPRVSLCIKPPDNMFTIFF